MAEEKQGADHRPLIRKIDEREAKKNATPSSPGTLRRRNDGSSTDGGRKTASTCIALRSTKELDTFLGNTLDEETKRIMEAAEAGDSDLRNPILPLPDRHPSEGRTGTSLADEPIRSCPSTAGIWSMSSERSRRGEGGCRRDREAQCGGVGSALAQHPPALSERRDLHSRHDGQGVRGLCAYCQRMYDFQAGASTSSLRSSGRRRAGRPG